MTFPFIQFIPGYEGYCVWRSAFTPEECQMIIDMGEQLEFQKGRTGGNDSGSITDHRDTDITWLNPTHQNDWIHKRIAGVAARVNFDKFQLSLQQFDGFQYSKYKPSGHYNWHIDCIGEPENPSLHRKLSMSVMLTAPADYEGGELLLLNSGNPEDPTVLKPEIGDMVCFYSFVSHKVAPVISGERITLVTWAVGEKFV
jgi:PKHD-type hydroxylase